MADLNLNGPLNLVGRLNLVGQGGKVLVRGAQALVEGAEGKGVPVPLPPQSPQDPGKAATCVKSLGAGITAANKTLVTTGMVLQGDKNSWPGMLGPSGVNSGPTAVTANRLPINVLQDKATIFPNGGTATFDVSGQPVKRRNAAGSAGTTCR